MLAVFLITILLLISNNGYNLEFAVHMQANFKQPYLTSTSSSPSDAGVHHPPTQLSSGDYARLSLAQAPGDGEAPRGTSGYPNPR